MILTALTKPLSVGWCDNTVRCKLSQAESYIEDLAAGHSVAMTLSLAFLIIGGVFYCIVRHYSRLLQQKEKQMQALIDSLNTVSDTLASQTEKANAAERETGRISEVLIDRDVFVESLRRNPHYLQDGEWKCLIQRIDQVYDNYTSRLKLENPLLTDNNVRLSCLVKLRFSNRQIADIMGISPTSVVKAKQRLRQRCSE